MTPTKDPQSKEAFKHRSENTSGSGAGSGAESGSKKSSEASFDPGPLLSLDTATKTASVALIDPADKRILARRDAPVRTHGKALVPLIQEALEEAGLAAHALAAVACGAGPGSFTGVRVGLATAKGLCLIDDLPLVLIPSLHALAARANAARGEGARQASPRCEVLVAPCLDARRGEVYVSLLAFRPGAEIQTLLDARALPPAAALDALGEAAMKNAAGPKSVGLLGTGLSLLEEPLQGAKHRAVFDPRSDLDPWPDAGAMAAMAAEKLSRGYREELAAAQPIYLRASDAEQNFNLDLSPSPSP